MSLLHCKCSEKWGDAGILLLRLTLAAIFIYHGWTKIGVGAVEVAAFFASVGIPAAPVFAVIVPWVEVVGGLMLLLGLYAHWAAKILAIVALVALVTVHVRNGFNIANGGYEFILLILVTTLSVMATGAGKYSLDNKWLHHRD